MGATTQPRRLTIESQLDTRFLRYKVLCAGQAVCCFNVGRGKPDPSFPQRRPSLHPVYTPAGMPVTEQGAHNFPHHKGVWIAHGNVGGVNFYADADIEGLGRIVTHECPTHVRDDGAAVLDALLYWQSPDGRVLLEEHRQHVVFAAEPLTCVLVRTTYSTPQDEVTIAKEKHGFFHVRAIDALDVDDGARLEADNGFREPAKIFGSHGRWIDCRGAIGPHRCGVLIGVAPDAEPQPLFARAYGTIALNPYLQRSEVLRRGQERSFLYGCAAYDGHEASPAEVYRRLFSLPL